MSFGFNAAVVLIDYCICRRIEWRCYRAPAIGVLQKSFDLILHSLGKKVALYCRDAFGRLRGYNIDADNSTAGLRALYSNLRP